MGKYKRIFVVVLDSLGIGAVEDSPEYGDVGERKNLPLAQQGA